MKTTGTLFMLFFAFFISNNANAQDLTPIEWSFEVEKVKNGEYKLTSTAKISGEWTLYSQHTADGGPVATAFTYENVELIGETEEKSEAIKKMSDLFEIEVIKFKREAVFVQHFKVKEGQKSIVGNVRFMCCDGQKCLAPTEVSFDVLL